jgi:DNA-binding FadR family transcriptional regulator
MAAAEEALADDDREDDDRSPRGSHARHARSAAMTGIPDSAPVRRIRPREQVLAQLQAHILKGRWRAGDRLPDERELSEALAVGRLSIRQALRTLETTGILETLPRPGREPSRILAASPTAALGNLFHLHMAVSRFSLKDLVETRVQLERSAAKRAASGATAADLSRLRDLVEDMNRPGVGREEFHELDCEFHLGLAAASHNTFAAGLMQALRKPVESEMKAAFASSSDWPRTAAQLAGDHQSILAAIQHHHVALAECRVSEHIAGFYHRDGARHE